MAYMETPEEYSLFWLIFWNICTFVWIKQLSLFSIVGTYGWYLPLIHLKYQFIQINDSIDKCIHKPNNGPKLTKLIAKHNTLTTLVQDINITFKYILFVLYYTAPIFLNMYVYELKTKSTRFIVKLVIGLLCMAVSLILFQMNSVCTLVTKNAHKSQSNGYKCLVINRYSLRQKWKIQAFIERLSGPDIGFYCYDLFPMNNYEFYQYLVNCIMNHFLLISIINIL